MQTGQLMRLLDTPPAQWEGLTKELGSALSAQHIQDTIKQIEGIAERATRLARHLEIRDVVGAGHASAVKAQNKAGRIIHEQIFCYNETHDLKI